jgi:hypothetical protein
MPGTAMHHMIAERLKGLIRQKHGLGDLSDEDYDRLNKLLDDPGSLPYLYLGAQGPDFLFFNVRDWPPEFNWILMAIIDVADFIDGWREKLLALVPDEIIAVIDGLNLAANEAVSHSATLQWLEGSITDMRNIMDGLLATAIEATKAWGTDIVNPFNLLGHPYRDGIYRDPLIGSAGPPDGETWWYFDALHYRRTGEYAKTLLERAPTDSRNHLYALGHLTHVAADTVGHAYVNLNSGGPYRSHSQRHRVAENFQDVFNYSLSALGAQKNLGRSQLHAYYNFAFDGRITPLDETDESDQLPPTGTPMPDELASFIASAINHVYRRDDSQPPGLDFGDPTSSDDIKDAYRLWYKWWRSATQSGTIPQPKPYSFTGELRAAAEQAAENAEALIEYIEGAADRAGSGGILGILAFLAALVIATLAAGLILLDFVLAGLSVISGSTIKLLMSLAYERIYAAYEYFRLMVALNGLALPMAESMNEPVMQQFKNPSVRDTSGINAANLVADMPLLRWYEDGMFMTTETHLTYPDLQASADGEPDHGERNPIRVAPQSYHVHHADWYAWGDDLSTDPDVITDLLKLSPSADPKFESDLLTAIWGTPEKPKSDAPLGNALTLTKELYTRWSKEGRIPDFNLDSDRGYGYLAWKQPWEDDHTPLGIVVQPPKDADADHILKAHDKTVEIQVTGTGATS